MEPPGAAAAAAVSSGKPVWESLYQSLQATVLPRVAQDLQTSPKKDFTVLRVSQLDANELDSQLSSLLAGQFKAIWVSDALTWTTTRIGKVN